MATRSRSSEAKLCEVPRKLVKKSELNKYQTFQSQRSKRHLLHLKEIISGLGLHTFSFLQILNNAAVLHISTKLFD